MTREVPQGALKLKTCPTVVLFPLGSQIFLGIRQNVHAKILTGGPKFPPLDTSAIFKQGKILSGITAPRDS